METIGDLARVLLNALDDDALEVLASALAPRLRKLQIVEPAADGWLNAEQAAEHLACGTDRIYDLIQLRKIEPQRDGRRLLFRRSDLDAYVAGT